MACEWRCLNGCCERLGKLRHRTLVWRSLVKAGKKEEAQRELGALLKELAQEEKPDGHVPSGPQS